MGCLFSKKAKDAPIPQEEKNIKLLLLGTGESGKSTFSKQLKIIHLDGFTEEERDEFKSAILNNVIFCARSLINGANTIGATIEADEAVSAILKPEYDMLSTSFPPNLVSHVRDLWDDEGIQKAFERQSEFQLYDSAQYFFENLDRIAGEDYVPSLDDVLRVRVKTTGISEIVFSVMQTTFRVVDVGGQRNERKKWMHCFDNVDSILFLVALSEYDLMCFEDSTTNRMRESIKIFSDTVNAPAFEDISFILFLNKNDLFEEKIKKTPLSVCFPDYEDPEDDAEDDDKAEQARIYIKEQFLRESKNTQKTIITHVICATNTDLVRKIFDSVKTIIIKQVVNAV